jgi:hypothetical protein
VDLLSGKSLLLPAPQFLSGYNQPVQEILFAGRDGCEVFGDGNNSFPVCRPDAVFYKEEINGSPVFDDFLDFRRQFGKAVFF